MQCSSVVLLCSSLEPLRNTLRPHTESNETIDKWVCSGYFTPDTGTRERENTRREHRNTTRRMTSAWCNLVVPCWKLIGCIRDSPLASKHSVFLPGTLQTASFLLVPGTLRRTPLYLEARVFTPSSLPRSTPTLRRPGLSFPGRGATCVQGVHNGHHYERAIWEHGRAALLRRRQPTPVRRSGRQGASAVQPWSPVPNPRVEHLRVTTWTRFLRGRDDGV